MIKCKHRENKEDAVYQETMPSLADQAGADETNVNIIMKKYAITGSIPGHNKPHIDMDLSLMPSDLRTMLEITREVGKLRDQLPRELKDIPWDKLDSMTNAELAAILTPPAQTPAKKDEPK